MTDYNVKHVPTVSIGNRLSQVKFPIWHIANEIKLDKNIIEYDLNKNGWLEYDPNQGYDEFTPCIKNNKFDWEKFAVTEDTYYNREGGVYTVLKFPNKYKLYVSKNDKINTQTLKDEKKRVIAEKIWSPNSDEGRKVMRSYVNMGDNEFQRVRIYEYDTNNNLEIDIVDYAFTKDEEYLSDGSDLTKEYFLLNGKTVKAEEFEYNKYRVIDENGKELFFRIK